MASRRLHPGATPGLTAAAFGAVVALLIGPGVAQADVCTWYQGGRLMTSSDPVVCSSRVPSPQAQNQNRAPAAARGPSIREQIRERMRAAEARRNAGQTARTNELMRQATEQVRRRDYAGARATFAQLESEATAPEIREAARLGLEQMEARLADPGAGAAPQGRVLATFGDGDRRMEAYGRTIPPACRQSVLDMVQGQESGDQGRAMSGFLDLEARCPAVLLGMAEEAGISLPRRVYSDAALANIRMAMGEDPATVVAQLFGGDPTGPVVAARTGKPDEERDPGTVMGALVTGRLQVPQYQYVGPSAEDVGNFVAGVGGVALGVLGALAGQGVPAPSYTAPRSGSGCRPGMLRPNQWAYC